MPNGNGGRGKTAGDTTLRVIAGWLAVAVLVNVSEAHAGQAAVPRLAIEPRVAEGNGVARFSGLITPEVSAALADWEQARGKRIVYLAIDSAGSMGGDVHSAIRIGRLLRRNEAAILLAGPCASACVVMIAGAVKRHSLDTGVGVHRPFSDTRSPRASPKRASGWRRTAPRSAVASLPAATRF